MNFLELEPEAFGLDITDLSLKIAKLKKRGNFFELASFGEMPIKEGVIEGGEIKNGEELTKIIQEGVKNVKGERLKTRYAILSAPEERAFLQVIQLPKMAEEELKTAISFEAENYIPLPIEEVYLDFQVIPPPYGELDHLDILLAALPKKTIDPYLSVVKKAGIQPLALEVESLSICRALIKEEYSPAPILIIDLGAARTGFIIFSGYSLRFSFSIPVNSQDFTKAISKNLNLNFEKAEELKIKYGLSRENEEAIQVFESLIPALVDLTDQIKRYLGYYQTHASHEHLPPERKLEKIFLSGGGANLKGLPNFLAEKLNLQVLLANPWINILPEGKKETKLTFEKSLSYVTALGLALRGIKKYD